MPFLSFLKEIIFNQNQNQNENQNVPSPQKKTLSIKQTTKQKSMLKHKTSRLNKTSKRQRSARAKAISRSRRKAGADSIKVEETDINEVNTGDIENTEGKFSTPKRRASDPTLSNTTAPLLTPSEFRLRNLKLRQRIEKLNKKQLIEFILKMNGFQSLNLVRQCRDKYLSFLDEVSVDQNENGDKFVPKSLINGLSEGEGDGEPHGKQEETIINSNTDATSKQKLKPKRNRARVPKSPRSPRSSKSTKTKANSTKKQISPSKAQQNGELVKKEILNNENNVEENDSISNPKE